MANDDIDEVLPQGLLAEQAGMPASEHDGQPGAQSPHQGSDFDGVPDHRAGKQGDAEAGAVFEFV